MADGPGGDSTGFLAHTSPFYSSQNSALNTSTMTSPQAEAARQKSEEVMAALKHGDTAEADRLMSTSKPKTSKMPPASDAESALSGTTVAGSARGDLDARMVKLDQKSNARRSGFFGKLKSKFGGSSSKGETTVNGTTNDDSAVQGTSLAESAAAAALSGGNGKVAEEDGNGVIISQTDSRGIFGRKKHEDAVIR